MQSIDDLPLVAMADSGPFFDAKDSPLPGLLARLARPPAQLRVAYLGTANGDNEDFFSLAEAAMQRLGLVTVVFVRTLGSGPPDLERLRAADVVVLSGGDPAAAMAVWEPAGIAHVLRQRAGQVPRTCLMIGVSAGAMQMARWVWAEDDSTTTGTGAPQLVPGLGIATGLPAMGMHEEKESWRESKAVVERVGVVVGVPFGGMALLQRDGKMHALRKPLTVLTDPSGQGTAVLPGQCWEPKQPLLEPANQAKQAKQTSQDAAPSSNAAAAAAAATGGASITSPT